MLLSFASGCGLLSQKVGADVSYGQGMSLSFASGCGLFAVVLNPLEAFYKLKTAETSAQLFRRTQLPLLQQQTYCRNGRLQLR